MDKIWVKNPFNPTVDDSIFYNGKCIDFELQDLIQIWKQQNKTSRPDYFLVAIEDKELGIDAFKVVGICYGAKDKPSIFIEKNKGE